MKKGLLAMMGFVLASGLILSGCASVPRDVAVRTANFLTFTQGTDLSEYDIIGNANVTGKITVDSTKFPKLVTGDTGSYGYLSDIESSLKTGQISVTQISGKEVATLDMPPSYAHRAYHNALYDLIEQAKERDASAVAFVTTKTNQSLERRGKIKVIIVEVSAVLLRLKNMPVFKTELTSEEITSNDITSDDITSEEESTIE
jgi:uncharacterized protein YbjQ (UPF0145 family)